MLRRANSLKVATFGKVNDPENSQVSKSESRPEVLQISAVVAAKTSQHKHISPPQPQFYEPLLPLSMLVVVFISVVLH